MTPIHTFKDFASFVKNVGVASPNRYDIVISFPPALQQVLVESVYNRTGPNAIPPQILGSVDTHDAFRSLSLMAQTVSVPGYSTQAIDSNMNSCVRKVPFARTWGEFDITFVCSGNMIERKIFDAWMEYIFKKNHRQEYYDNIIADIDLFIVSKDDKNLTPIFSTKFLECYPTVVTQINLDRSQQSSTMTFQVTFAFWKMSAFPDGDLSGAFMNPTDIYGNARNAANGSNLGILDGILPNDFLGTVKNIKNLATASFKYIDTWKAVQRAVEEIKKGVDPRRAIQMVNNLIRDVESTAGLDAQEAREVVNYLNDVLFSIQGFTGKIK
ncbi:hypothetical protein [Ralstonia phage RSP15]|uniref:tail tube protein n=1 Tax=Ralstonia phage RSP15 TaxID=1785960 RepID=UPI00074D2B61|nr:tail tube protein [Ralstonia phage RSP15]BAU40042.1 hypothetical protein [Ralstonia phage RSP15]